MRPWLVASAVVLLGPAAVAGQDAGRGRRLAIDGVVAVQDMAFETANWPTQIIVDSASTVQVRRGLSLNLRPVLWRVDGEWEALLDQASVRVETRRGGAVVRVEAGRFPSPIGLGMMENRASQNDGVLWCHRLYYGRLPTLGPGTAPHTLLSAIYPIGVSATMSTARWDVRAAALDRAPVDPWATPTRRLAAPGNFVAGVGITPRQGLRVGVASAWGTSTAAGGRAKGDDDYRVYNVEGEWAFGYTRVSGEWTRARFDAPAGPRTSSGLTLQARQTLSPRWFVHSRATAARAPRVSAAGVVTQAYRSIDSTLGYLLSADLTLRAGHSAVKSFAQSRLDHQLAVSVVWARRLW